MLIGFRSGRPWRPFLRSFSLAAVEIGVSEAVDGGLDERHDNRQLDETDIIRLEEQ